jgi:23S rRNA (uridine2552-2'-O)-methyltransferase
MGTYQRKDHYYKKAKEKGLPSRASFKIEEILKKFSLVKAGDTVLDLGAAPGGWTVILAKAVGPRGRVLAIDLNPLPKAPPPNCRFLQADLQNPEAEEWLKDQLAEHKAACLCSDMSPKLSGISFKDAYQSYELGQLALEVAKRWLSQGGHFVAKIFPGEEFQTFLKSMRDHFDKVKVFEPESSRKTSREVYVLGMGFKKPR